MRNRRLTFASFVDDLDVIDQGPVAGDLLALTNGFANALGGDVVSGTSRPIQPMLWTTTMRSASGRRRQLGKSLSMLEFCSATINHL